MPESVRMQLHPVHDGKIDWLAYKGDIDVVTDGPTVDFSPPNTLVVSISVDLSYCTGLVGDYVSPHVDLTTTTALSVGVRGTPPSDQLIGTMTVSRIVSNVRECEVLAAFAVAIGVASFGAGVPAAMAVLFVAGFALGFYGAADYVATRSSELSDKSCTQTKFLSLKSPEEQYECVYPVSADMPDPRDILPGALSGREQPRWRILDSQPC